MSIVYESVFQSDEQAISACPRDLPVKALKGKAIVWFLPYRRSSGRIEIPDRHKDQSVEAIIINDNGEHGLSPGVLVGVSRMNGEYFQCQGHRLCRVDSSALVLVNTEFSPEE